MEWVSQDKYFAFQKCVYMVGNNVVVGTLEIPLSKLAEVSQRGTQRGEIAPGVLVERVTPSELQAAVARLPPDFGLVCL